MLQAANPDASPSSVASKVEQLVLEVEAAARRDRRRQSYADDAASIDEEQQHQASAPGASEEDEPKTAEFGPFNRSEEVPDRQRFPGRFEVYRDRAGKYRFRLKASNGQVVAIGEAYETVAAAREGAQSVVEAARQAQPMNIRISTLQGAARKGARFEVYEDSKGDFRFRLFTSSGKMVATGEAYDSLEAVVKGTESVQQAALYSGIVETRG